MFLVGSAMAQDKLAKGYQMSAMGYDSLGLQVKLDEGRYPRRGFEGVLLDGCREILERNGVKCAVSKDGEPIKHYPCIIVDVNIAAISGGSNTGEEVYYGALSFNREVNFDIARRQWRGVASTWSMTLGGHARNRFEIISDVEERLQDFLVDYLKLNTARWIWK